MPANLRAKDLVDWLPQARREARVLSLHELITVPDREELGLGYYPNKETFEARSAQRFYERLPESTGLVFPYRSMFTDTFATIRELETETELREGRAYVYGRGRTFNNRTGLFGGHRLDIKRPHIILTDDEWRVCTDLSAVACLQLCPETLRRLAHSTRQVRLVSSDARWLESMTALVQEGFQVLAKDEVVQAGIARRIIKLLKSTRPREVIATDVRNLLAVLPPLEQVSLLQWLEKQLGVPLRSWLVPVPEAWDDQAEFITRLDTALSDRLTQLRVSAGELHISTKTKQEFRVPTQPEAFVGWWLQHVGDARDLVDWAYNSLGALPIVWLRDGEAHRFELHDRLTTLLWQRVWAKVEFNASI
jgi:hypothetical protein